MVYFFFKRNRFSLLMLMPNFKNLQTSTLQKICENNKTERQFLIDRVLQTWTWYLKILRAFLQQFLSLRKTESSSQTQAATITTKKIDVVNVVHRLARDVDVAKRRC